MIHFKESKRPDNQETESLARQKPFRQQPLGSSQPAQRTPGTTITYTQGRSGELDFLPWQDVIRGLDRLPGWQQSRLNREPVTRLKGLLQGHWRSHGARTSTSTGRRTVFLHLKHWVVSRGDLVESQDSGHHATGREATPHCCQRSSKEVVLPSLPSSKVPTEAEKKTRIIIPTWH